MQYHRPSLFRPKGSSASLEDIIMLLKIYADTRNLKSGSIFHGQLIKTPRAHEENVIQTNSLINFYAKCGRISVAFQLFSGMTKRNIVSWSALMAGYLHIGLAYEVLTLFRSMILRVSLQPNEYIFATVISAYSDIRALEPGRQCHGYVLKSGLVFHAYVRNALISMYSKCMDLESAMVVLKTLPQSDTLPYNSVITGLMEHGHLNEALEVLGKMVTEFVEWDRFTYVTVLGLCAHLKDLKLGLQVHNRVLRMGIEFDEFLDSAIIDMYGKCGRILSARNAFIGLCNHNVVSWTAIMAAYVQNGCFEEALNLFLDMDLKDVAPNEYTYAVILNSCAELSALGLGDLLNARTKKCGLNDRVIVGNALINMYAKSGNIGAAYQVFSDMVCHDIITWNSMISGYSHHGLGREALLVFRDMLAAEEFPDYVTFVGVLSACGHLCLVDEGLYYLNQVMKEFGITPGVEHYTCIVGLLCKAGLLIEAARFMRSTPVQWDVIAWRTLLSACHVHHNFNLGRRVAEVILELDPVDAGTYILLSNMYAKVRRWDGVVKIRKLMRGRDVKKEPGVSWIELRNKTHVFISEDKKRPESILIYKKIEELLAQIKQLGYVPSIDTVLHDVEDEQKEKYLSYHSEKLAVAYGLMNTPAGAPLRIIKNLRMCDDCHTAVKLISLVTKRTIIIRDANRFHCFESGGCSCYDYW
ncbi:pentatricopeptide repeat-containing protein At5g39680 [Telopea speciosissima]|uniref:pentatricopeptide repeat-containing protein At5g39680 n=1 Tax=Telopea speciosissima TaxID=54955 RepID=UPI001CC795D7|nr:pentatricopeptide repeat-containing protein At5g39680 [Telopea speciosissima]